MKNRTIRSAVYNQLGKNKIVRHVKPMVKHNGKKPFLLLSVLDGIVPILSELSQAKRQFRQLKIFSDFIK